MRVLNANIAGYRIGSEDICLACFDGESDEVMADNLILFGDEEESIFCDRCNKQIN